MEIKEILTEAPYHHKETKPKKFKGEPWIISLSTVKRNYKVLNTETIKGEEIFYLLLNGETLAGVFIKQKNKTPPEDDHDVKFEIGLRLFFKKVKTLINIPNDLKDKKILQVNYVEADDAYEGAGIASKLYVELVKAGYAVISDTAQFDGGVNLWKKLAKNVVKSGVVVRLLDDDEHGYLKDKSGKVITYDAKNIDDKEIWSSDLDLSKEHILLTLGT